MKRLLIALLVGGMVFGAVYGLAASLGVAGGGAQSGSVSAVCDANGVDLTWQNTDADADFEQATVAGIDCSGTLSVTVEGHDGAEAVLAAGTNSAGGSGTTIVTLSNDLNSPADVAALAHTHVTIVQTGP